MGFKRTKGDLRKRFAEYKRDYKGSQRVMAKKIAYRAVNHFVESFKLQKFNDSGSSTWKKPHKKTWMRKKTSLTLVESGKLMKSIRARRKTFKEIKIVSNRPYSRAHNRGEGKMPKRQFMGKSKTLSKIIHGIINREIKRIFR